MSDEYLNSIPTPFYLYNTQLLQDTLDTVIDESLLYDNYHVHYAIKANAEPRLLRMIQEAGLDADCVSGGEIEAALKAGFVPSSIFFAGVGKTDEEITLALSHSIGCFNVESEPELENISRLAQEMGVPAPVCLRINPEVGAHTHSHISTGRAEDKFGIAMGDMERLIERCHVLPAIHFRGLHFHIGSQILEMDDFRALALRINELQDRLESKGIHLDIIDVGGGLGVDYVNPHVHRIADFKAYFETYNRYLKQRPGQEIHFEPGRSIVAQCGTLITRVLYVKQGVNRKFVIVDAGMTDLIRPALYGAHHRICRAMSFDPTDGSAITFDPTAERETYDVVGPICESSDVFGTDVDLPVIHRGDLLGIMSAGAYGQAMASCYNCRPLAKAHFVDEEEEEKA